MNISAYPQGRRVRVLREAPSLGGATRRPWWWAHGGNMKRLALAATLALAPIAAHADSVTPRTTDYDTGSNTIPTEMKGVAIPASGGPAAVSGTNPLPVAIEYDADRTLTTFYEAVSTGRGTYQPSLGGTPPYSKITARNLGLTNPVCIRAKTGITRGVVVSARSAATSPPDSVSFRNVSTLEIDTSSTGCSGGTTVEIVPEQ